MFEIVRDVIETVKLINKNLPALKAELNDLSGVVKEVIEDLIKIWSD